MKTYTFFLLVFLFLASCSHSTTTAEDNVKTDLESLKTRALNNQDSTQWDAELYQQDVETYKKFKSVFQSFPLNKSPFPVANYDYAVQSEPFEMTINHQLFKAIAIGEYVHPESDSIVNKLILAIAGAYEESTLVDSRNFPYLTAQGTFSKDSLSYDWVFAASPDGYANLMLNMKHFDLRFGETILIFPEENNAFRYLQIEANPDDFKYIEQYELALTKRITTSNY